MTRNNIVIVSLIIFTWIAEDLYHLAPREYWFNPFLFSEKKVTLMRYLHDISSYLRISALAICIIILKPNWIIKDASIIALILFSFSLFWYLIFYGNPFYKQELWVKAIVTGLIYLIVFINRRWKAKPQY